MAAWQFDLRAVCRSSGEVLPPVMAERAAVLLDECFEPPSYIAEGWAIYGPSQGNRIDLVRDEDGTGTLHVRVDARSEADAFIAQVCILMRTLECTLYSPELGEFVHGQVVPLKVALQSSAAWRYTLDPGLILPTDSGREP